MMSGPSVGAYPEVDPFTARGHSKACATSSKVTPDKTKIGSVISELESRLATAAALAERLAKAMDFVTGPAPTAPNDASECAEVRSGAIGTAHERLQSLYWQLDRIDDGVRRLERVVG